MRQKLVQEQIDEIMDEFDFELCHKIFADNGFTYDTDGEMSVPSVGDLRRHCRMVLRSAAEHGESVECGRFVARCAEGEDETGKWLRLSLVFAPVSWVCDGDTSYQ
jgi:hypothetical protein